MTFENEIKVLKEENLKYKEHIELLLMWLQDYQDGRKIIDYFKKNNIRTIAIYGYADLGIALANELDETDVEVKYIIDKAADHVYTERNVMKPDGDLPYVDAIVVTAIHYFDAIKADMEDKVNYPILSLETVICGA
ncbi:hypothetical protein [Butyrivibrio sp. AE3006]|uniref:hypothetical protein n=1 Tax=Butyrivibrio sp. AE3006 TaxID=1280673 RepID=UPI0003F7E264|nr:hypothetical protein [Butyrivibrio sp. AE3006]